MKKIYLSILMILCPLLPGMAQQVSQTGRETVGQTGLRASAAQVSKPFLQEGKEWYYRSVYGPRGADINYYCKISGDTLVGDVSYWKLVNWQGKFLDGLHEEGHKVSSVSAGGLFDFNLQLNDTLKDEFGVVVSTSDTILVDEQRYFRLGIAPIDSYYEESRFASPREYWVEGIGSSYASIPFGACSSSVPTTSLTPAGWTASCFSPATTSCACLKASANGCRATIASIRPIPPI